MRFVKTSAAFVFVLTLAVAELSSQAPRLADARSGQAPRLADARSGQAGAYWCSMHPDVRGEAGARCPLCGMALVPRPATLDAYWLDLPQGMPGPLVRPTARP